MAWRTFLTTAVRTALGRSDLEREDLPFALVELDYRNGATAPPGEKRGPRAGDTASSSPRPEARASGSRWVEAGQVRF
jgi:hypothetical protein